LIPPGGCSSPCTAATSSRRIGRASSPPIRTRSSQPRKSSNWKKTLECYYDGIQNKLVLAPEYGGDGKKVGDCAEVRRRHRRTSLANGWTAMAACRGSRGPSRTACRSQSIIPFRCRRAAVRRCPVPMSPQSPLMSGRSVIRMENDAVSGPSVAVP
jgi:hypothetical protein